MNRFDKTGSSRIFLLVYILLYVTGYLLYCVRTVHSTLLYGGDSSVDKLKLVERVFFFWFDVFSDGMGMTKEQKSETYFLSSIWNFSYSSE